VSVVSGRHDTIKRVSQLHLVLGEEELFVERAIADVLRSARKQAGSDDVPVDRLRAGEVSTSELAELLSPSLFADERVVVLEAAAEAGKDAVALIAAAAADLPPGTLFIVVHSGGGRAKALADQLKKLGAEVHPCARITKASERADFVRGEFRDLKVKVSDDTVTAVLDGVGVFTTGRRHGWPPRRGGRSAVPQRQGGGEGLRHRRQGRRRRRCRGG
jgi:DNA polymerase III subunit delta